MSDFQSRNLPNATKERWKAMEFSLGDALKDAHEVIGELTYASYKANRGYTPTTTPEQWERIYGPTTQAMERRYQREKWGCGMDLSMGAEPRIAVERADCQQSDANDSLVDWYYAAGSGNAGSIPARTSAAMPTAPYQFPVCEMLHGESSPSPKGGSPKEEECEECEHAISQHGRYGCEVERDCVYGDVEFARAVPCGCQAHKFALDEDYYDMDAEERGEGLIESEEEDDSPRA